MFGINVKSAIGRVRKSVFFRNVLVLMSGTVLGQVIAVATAPILTRLYTSEAFGVFGVFMSIVGIISIASTLKYEHALMLPKEPEDAANLLSLSLLSVAGIAIVSGVVCVCFADSIGRLTNSPDLATWMWLVPIGVLAAGMFQTLKFWSARRKQFHRASVAVVVRAITVSGTQIVAGSRGAGPLGLIGGSIAGGALASGALAIQVLIYDWTLIRRSCRLARMRLLARKYSDFPLFSTPVALLNTLSRSMPLLLLAHYHGGGTAGCYYLAMRILQLPAILMLASLRQVLFQKASEVHRSGGDTYALFMKVTAGLLAVSAVPALILVLFGPMLFSFAFGAPWHMAGEYSRWLAVWLGVTFADAPTVLFIIIYRKQGTRLVQQVTSFICQSGALVIGGLYLTALQTVMLYSIVSAGFSAVIIVWMWWFLKTQVVKEEIV